MPASASASGLRLPVTTIRVLNPRTRRAPEGVVRCSNNNRDDLLNHDKGRGGGRIQIPGEPRVERTGTTLIGKKKRKRQRTVDEVPVNLSYSDSDPKTKTLAKTASDYMYSCKIDAVSEAEIVDAVQDINYSIDILISNIMAEVKDFRLSYHKVSPRTRKKQNLCDIPSNDIQVLQSLISDSPSLLSDDTRDEVVEIILHHLTTSLIHKHFFQGEHFFGVGSETHREYLETMFSKLIAGENSDPAAIQRWRSMCLEAIFQMNYEVSSELYDELTLHLKRTLKVAFPLSPSPRPKKVNPDSVSIHKSIVHGEHTSLLDVIRQARKISFMIQQVVSCQVVVTIAQSTQTSPDGDVLGTYSFGLQKILGPDRTILI